MELRIVNNHPLIEVQTNLGSKTCVVDTGSPFTFFYDDNVSEYHLNGVVYTPRQAPPIASGVNETQLIGERIDGFIGIDTLLPSTLLLSYRCHEVSIYIWANKNRNIILVY